MKYLSLLKLLFTLYITAYYNGYTYINVFILFFSNRNISWQFKKFPFVKRLCFEFAFSKFFSIISESFFYKSTIQILITKVKSHELPKLLGNSKTNFIDKFNANVQLIGFWWWIIHNLYLQLYAYVTYRKKI